MKKAALKTASTVDRLAAAAPPEPTPRIDRTGGRYSAGIIRGVSLCSVGEALGHAFWIDSTMLAQIATIGQDGGKLLKSRFTHPGLCGDGLGKSLGTIEGLSIVGQQAFGDLHFYTSAQRAPDGDLAGYVMSLAEEDPANFGLSIVFEHDFAAEEEFTTTHTTAAGFVSPDAANVGNFTHARIAGLVAADIVDQPAANPNGLFHRANELTDAGAKMLDFVFGRSTEIPALSELGVDIAPERLREFVSNHLAQAGLTLSPIKESPAMANPTKLAEDPPEEKKPDEKKPDETPKSEDAKPEADPAEPDKDDEAKPKPTEMAAQLSKFCDAFGFEAGAKFLLAGTSFEAAQGQHMVSLAAQLADAHAKLSAFATSGVQPVGFSAATDKQRDLSNKSIPGADVDNRAKFAAANAATTQLN